VTGWFCAGGVFATYLSKIFSARRFDRDKAVPGGYPLKNQINWRLVLNGFYYGPSGFLKGEKSWPLSRLPTVPKTHRLPIITDVCRIILKTFAKVMRNDTCQQIGCFMKEGFLKSSGRRNIFSGNLDKRENDQ